MMRRVSAEAVAGKQASGMAHPAMVSVRQCIPLGTATKERRGWPFACHPTRYPWCMAGGLTSRRVEGMADEGLLAQLGVPTSGLAGMLVETLPTGSQLVVRWRDASGREGNAATAGTSRLMDRSARLLAGEAVTAGSDEI